MWLATPNAVQTLATLVADHRGPGQVAERAGDARVVDAGPAQPVLQLAHVRDVRRALVGLAASDDLAGEPVAHRERTGPVPSRPGASRTTWWPRGRWWPVRTRPGQVRPRRDSPRSPWRGGPPRASSQAFSFVSSSGATSPWSAGGPVQGITPDRELLLSIRFGGQFSSGPVRGGVGWAERPSSPQTFETPIWLAGFHERSTALRLNGERPTHSLVGWRTWCRSLKKSSVCWSRWKKRSPLRTRSSPRRCEEQPRASTTSASCSCRSSASSSASPS